MGFQLHSTGSALLLGWTIVSGSVDTVDFSFFPAREGNQSLDLDGLSAGTIEQSIVTTPGSPYKVKFYYANNPILNGGATVPASANVTIQGANAALISQTITHSSSSLGSMNFTLFEALFTADSTTTILRFSSFSPANSTGGIVLDSVSVIPEATLSSPELTEVFIQASSDGQPPKFSGTVVNGPPMGTARLQASLDLGTTDPWGNVLSLTLDAQGSAIFTNIPDSRSQAIGARSDFFRVVTEPPSTP